MFYLMSWNVLLKIFIFSYLNFQGNYFDNGSDRIHRIYAHSIVLVSNMKYGTDINIICSVRNIEKAEALFSNLKNSEQLVYITNGLVACNDSVDYIFHTAAPTTSKFLLLNQLKR